MHQRMDALDRDPAFTATVRSWGLDRPVTVVGPSRSAEPVAS